MDLEKIKSLIETDLEEVEEVIRQTLITDRESTGLLIDHAAKFSGKRLRPALILLIGKALGDVKEDHFKLAAVVELIHTATLVHDDILDHASMRRRTESINFLHGNHVAVLLGDLIYAKAFQLSLTLSSTEAAAGLAEVTKVICSGEIEQIYSRGRFDLTEDEYFDVIGAKTASLYRSSCELAAFYSGASQETISALGDYGYSLGVAFQIVDDCLDVIGEEQLVGKSLGTDLECGKMTLPMIRLAAALSKENRDKLESICTSREISEKKAAVTELFDLRQAVDSAFRTADEYIRNGMSRLDVLGDSPCKDALRQAAEFILIRKV